MSIRRETQKLQRVVTRVSLNPKIKKDIREGYKQWSRELLELLKKPDDELEEIMGKITKNINIDRKESSNE